MTMTILKSKKVPFLVSSEQMMTAANGEQPYFDYVAMMQRIVAFLQKRLDCGIRLYYQEDNNDIWDMLEEDIRRGDGGVEHAASLYDLVETDMFRFQSDLTRRETKYEICASVRNNLFVYPQFRVAFARIPKENYHGLGTEDIMFAESDEALSRFLEHMRERQLADRKIILYSDTRNGLDSERMSATQPVTRDDVCMEESLKTHIYRSVDEFFAGEGAFFREYGISYKRGILLYGKPGNGKTTLVKSISSTVNAPVAYWQITEYTSSESISEVFSAAVRIAPMVLVIEDIDSMPESCRSYFLNTLDGISSKEGVFLIGTTNYPERIDPALMNRAGRFDRAYEVKSPDEPLRYEYLLRKGMERLADRETIALIAKRTEGFTCAQLSELYVSAALQKHYEGDVDLEELAASMKSDFSKSKTGEWMKEDRSRGVGFL
ncbi:AAA family ATPase [Paenibacillus sp. GCM10027627]|uniref:AAA family ATPase n=1 Tax=unclassified Paenibacillus TaxID=185978 RepID=UPI00362CAE34